MKSHITRTLQKMTPSKLLEKRKDKSLVVAFGEQFGLVYFGFVSQQDDEHKLVRGLTLSNQHSDAHYCIGTYDNYDVAFVERRDTIANTTSKHKTAHRWHIMAFDLHTSIELPHVFVGRHSHSESFYTQLFTKYSSLRSLHLGNLGTYKADFLAEYRVYGQPAKVIEIESLLSPIATEMLSKHFGTLAIEIEDGTLYVYSEKPRLSLPLLEAMIKNGVWMARHIDSNAQMLQEVN